MKSEFLVFYDIDVIKQGNGLYWDIVEEVFGLDETKFQFRGIHKIFLPHYFSCADQYEAAPGCRDRPMSGPLARFTENSASAGWMLFRFA